MKPEIIEKFKVASIFISELNQSNLTIDHNYIEATFNVKKYYKRKWAKKL